MTSQSKNVDGGFIEEQDDPQNDPRGFRRSLGQFATGVTVVTTGAPSGPIGMAVNSFAAVSLDPPLVSWSIRNESKNLKAFTEGKHFAISVLAEDQVDVCAVFGRPQDGQFDAVPWTESMHSDPLLEQAIAHFECTVEDVHVGGDHHILIGRVHRFTRFSGAPLLFSQGQYKVAVEHPQLANSSASDTSTGGSREAVNEPLFVSLLKTTEQYLSSQFNEYRDELGLDSAETKLINLLDLSPSNASRLAAGALMRIDAVEDAISELMSKGIVARNSIGFYELTARGKQTRSALLTSATAFNERMLGLVEPAELETTRKVLMQLLTS